MDDDTVSPPKLKRSRRDPYGADIPLDEVFRTDYGIDDPNTVVKDPYGKYDAMLRRMYKQV